MTGDKPDPRLRTPMQWNPRSGVGFTSGTPWESPQPDSLTTTVAAQDGDRGSLLNLYRRLIHLRRADAALAAGRLVPLSASSPQVLAYLRHTAGHAVLVVANLGTTSVTGVALASAGGALPPGRYQARNLLARPPAADLRVGPDGAVSGYVPVPMMGPRASLALGLDRR